MCCDVWSFVTSFDFFMRLCGFISVVIAAIMGEVNAIFVGLFHAVNGDRHLASGFRRNSQRRRRVTYCCLVVIPAR